MAADGLTKGSVDRSALSAIMDGNYKVRHVVHEFREPKNKTTATASSDLYASGGGGAYGTSPSAVLERGSDVLTSWLISCD